MKLRKILKTTLLCSALLAALLAGCGREELPPEVTTEPSSAPAVYTVRFQVEGLTLSVQLVKAGEGPSAPEVALEGLVFSHWVSEEGVHTDPETEKIVSDRVFTAVTYPDLSSHKPYLFADENGFVHPEGLLTGGELDRALKTLAVKETALSGIVIDTEAASFTIESLQKALEKCFPAERVENALKAHIQDAVTRSVFARVMNALLGRGGPAEITGAVSLPRDLDLQAEDAPAILEAVLEHTHTQDGSPIEDGVYSARWQPGFALLDGWLYYADENGVLLTDGKLGKLRFGADGRYTTGDGDLDRLVAEKIREFTQADPAADRLTLLYEAFAFARDSYNYVNRGVLKAGATGWETEKAKQMFDMGSGNCYNYAAVFWALARGLGYEAVCYSGKALSDRGPHAWVQIKFDGQPYIFDPQLARRGADGERNNYGEDMYMVAKDIWYMWRYDHP